MLISKIESWIKKTNKFLFRIQINNLPKKDKCLQLSKFTSINPKHSQDGQ